MGDKDISRRGFLGMLAGGAVSLVVPSGADTEQIIVDYAYAVYHASEVGVQAVVRWKFRDKPWKTTSAIITPEQQVVWLTTQTGLRFPAFRLIGRC